MKKFACLVALLCVFGWNGVAKADGWLYTGSTLPVDPELQTANADKKGTATCYNVLSLVEWGNCGLQAAMQNGKMTQVHHWDMSKSGWIVFMKITTEVYGK